MRRTDRTSGRRADAERVVGLRIRLAEAPPRTFCQYAEIEGGIQQKDDVLPGEVGPDGLPRFRCELRARRDPVTGAVTFLGPCAFGPPRGRFVYVSWSHAGGGTRRMFRRMKVPLGAITWAQVEEVADTAGLVLEATVPGIAADGGPACATVPLRGGWLVRAV